MADQPTPAPPAPAAPRVTVALDPKAASGATAAAAEAAALQTSAPAPDAAPAPRPSLGLPVHGDDGKVRPHCAGCQVDGMVHQNPEGCPGKHGYHVWAQVKRTPLPFYNGARYQHGWALGKEVTEAEYDAAIDATANGRIG